MTSSNPLTKPKTDSEGNLLPDDGPPLYLVAELDNGDEEFVMATNMSYMAHRSAQGLSLEMGGQCESCRIIDGETHQALWRYEKGIGIQENWREEDDFLASVRRNHISACTPLPGKRIIAHSKSQSPDE